MFTSRIVLTTTDAHEGRVLSMAGETLTHTRRSAELLRDLTLIVADLAKRVDKLEAEREAKA